MDLMVSCGIPELPDREAITFLRDTLMVRLTDEEAGIKFCK